MPVLPDDLAGRRVEGLHEVAGARQEHHAVVHDRGGLVVALRHGQRPGQPQPGHVLGADLVQRAVALVVAGPPPGEPVLGRRVPEQLVGDRREVGDLAVDERPGELQDLGVLRRVGAGRIRDRVRRCAGRSRPGFADHGPGVRGEGRRPRRVPVLLQEVGDDVQIGVAGQRTAEPGRHLDPHVVEQLGRGTRPPVVQEAAPRQLRPVRRTPQRRPVAGGAGATVGHPSTRGLRLEKRAARRRLGAGRCGHRDGCCEGRHRDGHRCRGRQLPPRPRRPIAPRSGSVARVALSPHRCVSLRRSRGGAGRRVVRHAARSVRQHAPLLQRQRDRACRIPLHELNAFRVVVRLYEAVSRW